MSASLIVPETHGRTVKQEMKAIRRAVERILRHPNEADRTEALIQLEEMTRKATEQHCEGMRNEAQKETS